MGPSKQLTVSVVVPCLNRAHFVGQTIESILKQDYPHVECIVVDGGSADGTVQILRSYGDKIKWVSEPDGGHADAINKGWKMSAGDILAWLNADDTYVVPDAVRKAVDYLAANPEVDVVYGDYATISESGAVISEVIKPRPWDLAYAVKYCFYTIPQPASFIRRCILERVNWLDPEFRYGKDHELWLRIGLAGRIQYIPFHLAYARSCPGLSQDGMAVSESLVKLTQKFFNLPDLPAPFRSKSFQRRALSNAYLTASLYAWNGGRRARRLMECVLRAVAVDPSNLPYVTYRLSRFCLSSILPYGLKRKIRRLVKPVEKSA